MIFVSQLVVHGRMLYNKHMGCALFKHKNNTTGKLMSLFSRENQTM